MPAGRASMSLSGSVQIATIGQSGLRKAATCLTWYRASRCDCACDAVIRDAAGANLAVAKFLVFGPLHHLREILLLALNQVDWTGSEASAGAPYVHTNERVATGDETVNQVHAPHWKIPIDVWGVTKEGNVTRQPASAFGAPVASKVQK